MRVTRRGFTLVELLAALVITAFVGGALFRLLDRSQRFARGIAHMADQRAQLAVAMLAVESSVLGVSPSDGDLLAGSDSSVAYLGNVGSAVACVAIATNLELPPSSLASAAILTWWNTAPQAGDSVAVFDEGPALDAIDDRWFHSAIMTVAPMTNACLHSPYADSIADLGKVGWRVTLSRALPVTVAQGALVRFSRAERLALYRSSGEWMLGWTEWNSASGVWNVIQPAAGPLLPYASPGSTSGLRLTWRDSLGAVVAPSSSSSARAVDLQLGAVTRQAVRVDGTSWRLRRDSVTRRIALRSLP